MKGRKPNLNKARIIASVHFKVHTTTKVVSVPDAFIIGSYPIRTQNALRILKTNGYHIQTSIN